MTDLDPELFEIPEGEPGVAVRADSLLGRGGLVERLARNEDFPVDWFVGATVVVLTVGNDPLIVTGGRVQSERVPGAHWTADPYWTFQVDAGELPTRIIKEFGDFPKSEEFESSHRLQLARLVQASKAATIAQMSKATSSSPPAVRLAQRPDRLPRQNGATLS